MEMASNTNFQRASTLVALGCTLGAALFLSLGNWGAGEVQAAPDAVHRHPSQGSLEPRRLDEGQGERRLVAASPNSLSEPELSGEPSPAALMLDAYYGPDAGAVRAALAQRGIDPDQLNAPVPEAEFRTFLPHWMALSSDERESRKRKEQAWPEPLTSAFLQSEFGLVASLGPMELATIDGIAKLYAPDIDAAVDRYFDHLDVALAMDLEAGRVLISPFLAWPPAAQNPAEEPSGHSDTVFYSLIRSGQGWVARAALSSRDHPEAYAARASIAAAVGIRHHAIAKSLASLQR